jgi:hypothetical protein
MVALAFSADAQFDISKEKHARGKCHFQFGGSSRQSLEAAL